MTKNTNDEQARSERLDVPPAPQHAATVQAHTLGPWTACKGGDSARLCECGFIWDASGSIHVASVHDVTALGSDYYGSDTAVSAEEREANSRLIASAPELLAALKMYVDHFGDPLKVARAAIAKAQRDAR